MNIANASYLTVGGGSTGDNRRGNGTNNSPGGSGTTGNPGRSGTTGNKEPYTKKGIDPNGDKVPKTSIRIIIMP